MAVGDLGITLLADGQNQAEILVNDTTERLTAFAQFSVKDRNAVTPPGSPLTGDRYHLGGSPSGVWAGQAAKIALFIAGTWYFLTPKEGWLMWVDNEDLVFQYDGTNWKLIHRVSGNVKKQFLTIIAPGAAEDKTWFKTKQAITITRLMAVLVTAVGSPSVSWRMRFDTDRSATGTLVISAGTTTTSITTGSDTGTFNNANIPADSWVWIETTASNLVAGDQITIVTDYVEQEPA